MTPPGAIDGSRADAIAIAPDGTVVARDAAMFAPAPRPLAPLSTATTSSRRPTLRWELPVGSDGARVDLCRDRACTQPIITFDAAGGSGAPSMDLPTGVAFWRLHARNAGTVASRASATWQFTVGARSAPINTSWGTTLDVNGDGFADVAVGAVGPIGVTDRAYLYRGGAGGLAASPTTLVSPMLAIDGFGVSVASAGDVNGDGFGDLVVGAGLEAGAAGSIYVYLGGPSGLATTASEMIQGPVGSTSPLGAIVASAGDVDGDGYADVVVVGAYALHNSAYVFLGSASGLAMVPATTMTVAEDGLRFLSAASGSDVNGDGYADIALGIASNVLSITGRVALYLGSAHGISTTPSIVLAAPGGESSYGRILASTDDVDGDGHADLAVGTQGSNGRVYIYSGGAMSVAAMPVTVLTAPFGAEYAFPESIAGAGDVNGDGFADLVVGTVTGPGQAYVYLGSPSGVVMGSAIPLVADTREDLSGMTVAGAGDVDGDGFAEVLVGAPGGMADATAHAFLYRGSAGGSASMPSATLTAPDGAGSGFGSSVASALDAFALRAFARPRI